MKANVRRKLCCLVVAPSSSQALPKSAFDELPPLSALPVPPGAAQSVLCGNVICQRCNHWRCSNHGTMQSGSRSGESRTGNQAWGQEDKAIFFHLPSTQPSGLNYKASVGLAAERLIMTQLSSKSAMY